jgi:CubicO group peptidase (beta-lactamase class C family)
MGRENNGQLDMTQIEQLMQQAVTDKVFPGAVLLVSQNDQCVFHAAFGFRDFLTNPPMTTDTIFDLASLTKPLATALAVMVLVQQKKVSLDQNLGDVLPAFNKDPKASIKVKHLLYHNSGLADYKAFYKKIAHRPLEKRKAALRKLLVKEPLVHPIGSRVVYSDIGFMILEWLVEEICGKRLDHFVSEMIYNPLGLGNLFFIDLEAARKPGVFAATEQCPWRRQLQSGQVHDENAYVVGGVQGHAGLFGTALDVHSLLSHLLSAYHGRPSTQLFQPDMVRLFFRRLADNDKALGFDAPSLNGSSSGKFFSRKSVGHLGFTGASFWMDLDRSIIVILLTNRVHPTRGNEAIKAFRPELHDAVMQHLLGSTVQGSEVQRFSGK